MTKEFKAGPKSFTVVGKFYPSDESPSLYHGHGTFKFIPEPEYTWQWIYTSIHSGVYGASSRYTSEAEFIKSRGYTPKWYQRIEESKSKV